MDTILTPILQEIDRINNVGFSLMMPKVVRIKLLFGIFDLIAKAQVLNMKQFNGSYGCPTCLHPGEYHSNQVYPPASYPLHTEETIQRARLDQALLKQQPPHEFARPPRSIKYHLSY